ncbi:hypothetical protein TNCV_3929911 [Trichonephila clavipes]|nr:hypothetical protein TNCV_3929911 [Trichonephila clavipes]
MATSSLTFMKLPCNEWYCHQKDRPRSQQSIDILTGLLLGIKRNGIGGERLLSLLVTLLLSLKESFPGKQSNTVLQRVAFTSGIRSGESLCLLPTGNIRYCGANYISHGHDRNEGVFFSVMCRNVPEEVVLVECSSESEVCFHLSYVTKIDRFGDKGNLVCCSIMLGCRTPLYIFDVSSATL